MGLLADSLARATANARDSSYHCRATLRPLLLPLPLALTLLLPIPLPTALHPLPLLLPVPLTPTVRIHDEEQHHHEHRNTHTTGATKCKMSKALIAKAGARNPNSGTQDDNTPLVFASLI